MHYNASMHHSIAPSLVVNIRPVHYNIQFQIIIIFQKWVKTLRLDVFYNLKYQMFTQTMAYWTLNLTTHPYLESEHYKEIELKANYLDDLINSWLYHW